MRQFMVALALAATVILSGCGGGGGTSGEDVSLSDALAVEPQDRRGEVTAALGTPDTFVIRFEELEGKPVRWESWNYHDLGTGFDFVDGEVAASAELEPLADGSLYAHGYDPSDFEAGMSPEEVQAVLGDVELVPLDVAESDLEGATVLAGEQILLGFSEDALVYVETVALEPEGTS